MCGCVLQPWLLFYIFLFVVLMSCRIRFNQAVRVKRPRWSGFEYQTTKSATKLPLTYLAPVFLLSWVYTWKLPYLGTLPKAAYLSLLVSNLTHQVSHQ